MSALTDTPNFTGHFLIAMPAMGDGVFGKTLTYICEHNDQGALGLVVNRQLDLKMAKLMEQIEIPLHEEGTDGEAGKASSLGERRIHFGGPVQQDRGFVLHRPIGDWNSTLKITSEIGLTTSKDILKALAEGKGPHDMLLTLGYAGWSAGQLESEIAQNSWLTVEATPGIIFSLPIEERLDAAMGLIGANWATLSGVAGRA